MANGYFKFKQFTVWHDRCAMKVGTDGVLLGAWASLEHTPNDSSLRMLDVGCGSGLIALMLAQRFTQAKVVGVELDDEAATQAKENVIASPWSDRVEVMHGDFCCYQPELPFHLIVSNPPYFVDALRPPKDERSLARHVSATSLNYETLFAHSRTMLAPDGNVCVILPAEVQSMVVDAAVRNGLHVTRRLQVFTKPGKLLRRVLISFSTQLVAPFTASLCLMNGDGSRSFEYQMLTEEFYLK